MDRQPFGIALNGILFDPGTAEFFQRAALQVELRSA